MFSMMAGHAPGGAHFPREIDVNSRLLGELRELHEITLHLTLEMRGLRGDHEDLCTHQESLGDRINAFDARTEEQSERTVDDCHGPRALGESGVSTSDHSKRESERVLYRRLDLTIDSKPRSSLPKPLTRPLIPVLSRPWLPEDHTVRSP